MPDLSGLDTARRIRGLGGPAGAVPIVALTARICPEDEAACAATGMNGMLEKSLALRELPDAIARYAWPYRHARLPVTVASAPDEPPALPVLSSARLNELRATLPADTLANLVEDCLLELSERLTLLLEAVRAQAVDEIIAHAHAMVGMAAEYGMAALETRLRTLLQTARQTPQSASVLTEALEVELFRAATALRETFQIELV